MGFIAAFLFFIQSEEFVYDPRRFDLFSAIYNTINEHNQRQTHYLSYTLIYINFHIYFQVNQKVLLELYLLHH